MYFFSKVWWKQKPKNEIKPAIKDKKEMEIPRINYLTKPQVVRYMADIDKVRERYINSERYIEEMISIYIQNLNFKWNDILEKRFFETDSGIEFISLYRQVLDIHPEVFEERNIKRVQESLQNSIYSSVDSELSRNFIKKLVPNDPDSFLLFPVSVAYPKNEAKGHHCCTFIVRKKGSKILVETFDKAAVRVYYPDEQASLKELKIKIWEKNQELSVVYAYEIKNTNRNIFKLAEAIRDGRGHLSSKEEHEQEESDNPFYAIFNKISIVAEKEYYTKHIATGQYVQGNCKIKNVSSALQYLLGVPQETNHILADGTKAIKVKYNGLSKEQLNSTILQLMVQHLGKLGVSLLEEPLKEDYLVYKQLKEQRSFKEIESKISDKHETGKKLNDFYSKKRSYTYNKEPIDQSINYSYSKEHKNFFKKHLMKNTNKKIELNHLTKKEILEIREKSKKLAEGIENDKINRPAKLSEFLR